ncbi:hypothetical protein LCI18_011558 [Fusarium solani-melongenae]|uniref:Uncharacterized protein n=1 Tax=Fusarium solani subsp. cucurbitae TaxID=2747967 RepID=A0ACD3ZKL0_FUSSC|nr:hypothetical protein LCI18_011558 [Fusarium solani-melongenae]
MVHHQIRASAGPFLAIAIDFGTTYSGVSYAVSTFPDSIVPITGYPGSEVGYNDPVQVPSVLDLDTGTWGYEVAPSMRPMRWFKMLLLREEDMGKDTIQDAVYVREARQQLRERGRSAENVVAIFLSKLWEHTLAQLGTKMLDGLPFKVAITVPAIWPPYAEEAMRRAAAAAGILEYRHAGDTTLELIQEPEAAALSILLERRSLPEIAAGNSFVVCDAGGGTVDVISYIINSTNPYQVKECVTGDGRLAGATLIDEAFVNHLYTQTSLKINDLGRDEYQSFMARWEMNPKRLFNGQPEQPDFVFDAPIKAVRAWNRVRKRTELRLTSEEMEFFFAKSYTGIRMLISEQLKRVKQTTGRRPNHIFLVGGLGDSPYIYNKLKALDKSITVLRPHSRWSAVASGGVMRLLRDGIITRASASQERERILKSLPEVTSRKSRYSYGIAVRNSIEGLTDFDKDKDEVETDVEGRNVTYRMKWYLVRGEEVLRHSPVEVPYVKYVQDELPPKCIFSIRYSRESKPPKRREGTKILCQIECDWDKPIDRWKRVGNPSDGWRKHDDLTLGMTFEGGQPKWHLRVGTNTEVQNVQITYMD